MDRQEFGGTPERDGEFVALDGNCYVGDNFVISGQLGTMNRDDGFADYDVDFAAIKADYWVDDYTVLHVTGAVSDSNSTNKEEARQFTAGISWQFNPELPIVVSADLNYVSVEDLIRTQDVWTAAVSIKLFNLGDQHEIVPTYREYELHSAHTWALPPLAAFQAK